ncbi:putative RNA methyltransferase [Sansalvadorimonas verongulae]|uniref:putative RNA methyltransferase n=1 Tax=Sansalvadorimonas verongulae TaxID=2172824 RepID=UPI0012BC349C|nr:methyltransferase domain-containing protein [Sansalvadorimonas verongulae]MTI12659.1 methyltransferase domain-containing protein [Sansalvadorimonas verongulae]
MPTPLRCPVCRQPLLRRDHGAACANRHSFDRARQGYLNLLPSHKKRSASPGDSIEMVQARTRFLDTDLYNAPATALIEAIHASVSDKNQPVIVDAGCGEGYYTTRIADALPKASVTGFDISKPAVVQCCRRKTDNADLQWLVASVADIPLPDDSTDVLVSVFSRIDWNEFARLLKPGGQVMVLGPGPDHLLELRQTIYEDVRSYPEDKLLETLPDGFELTSKTTVTDTLNVPDCQTIMDLLAMTPHFWHIKPAQRDKLEALQQLHCRLDMRLYVITYQPAASR